jgi:(1->4)-alpha-D-glucan 1-alpha-D-glucosylmutase
VLVDQSAEEELTEVYRKVAGVADDWEQVTHAAKHQIMSSELASEIGALSGRLAEICARYRRHRDHTRRDLHHSVREVLAGFDVYRTYVQPGRPVAETDVRVIEDAVDRATQQRPDLDRELFEFIGELLQLRHPGRAESEFAARFPQVAAPVMAKGVEDTAFYRYHRLVSLCEVGGDPGLFGRSPAAFHAEMAEAVNRPEQMVTLSTHDTKRSADVRARVHVLSELVGPWARLVEDWCERHAGPRGAVDLNTAYLLYQSILGAWPLDEERLVSFAEKATKEAKVHTSWTEPDAAYDDSVASFCRWLIADGDFRAELEGFLAEHRVVERGRLRSLAQVTLLCTVPGVPDLYQGSEIWDLSLVDPDNRRPVDHEAIRALAGALGQPGAAVPAVTGDLDDPGTAKCWLTGRLLDHLRSRPDRYRSAIYEPIGLDGPAAERLLAFTRGDLVAVVSRLGVDPDDLAATTARLPAGSWVDVLTGERHDGGRVDISKLLAGASVSVLDRDETST